MNNSHEDKILLSEAKKALDRQVQSLDFPIRSRLTQARFHAIDHGSLTTSNGFLHGSHLSLRGAVVASVLASVFIITMLTQVPNKQSPLLSEINQLPEVNQQKTVKSSVDTQEDIEIYNWLYDRYG
ncbi:MAG: hypothetical protein V3U87_01615 [Methylococcaceae bacterium]